MYVYVYMYIYVMDKETHIIYLFFYEACLQKH